MARLEQVKGGLDELKRRARELLDKLPWQHIADSPTTKYYTDWKLFEKQLAEARQDEGRAPVQERQLEGYDATIGPCTGGTVGNGLQVYRLEEAPSELAKIFASMLQVDETRLTAAHYAFLEEAYVLEIREPGVYRVAVCRPQSAWGSSHLVVAVEPGVEAALLLDVLPAGGGSTAVELVVGENSGLELLTVARPPEGTAHALLERRLVLEGAWLRSATIALGSAMHRVEEKTLLAKGASLVHRGAGVAVGSQRLDYIADTIHQGTRSRSSVRVYGFALDESMVAARGVASIRETAQGSSASFDVEVLILGQRARGYTMPLMEIDTGDVEHASHHAAQYRVSREQLFYMQSRGLSEAEALELLLAERLRTTAQHLEKLAEKSERIVEEILARLS
ncbi:Iron-sulfur cluster assembly protein SufD [Pyrodictium delaneyi]|nr:SufD family Fe-S cluster assembly protein [Pyrodictium delaneyi]ALL01876.1 Iron-sulfur cluster assembly protein SufD [Pyrodictium delaneyi]